MREGTTKALNYHTCMMMKHLSIRKSDSNKVYIYRRGCLFASAIHQRGIYSIRVEKCVARFSNLHRSQSISIPVYDGLNNVNDGGERFYYSYFLVDRFWFYRLAQLFRNIRIFLTKLNLLLRATFWYWIIFCSSTNIFPSEFWALCFFTAARAVQAVHDKAI